MTLLEKIFQVNQLSASKGCRLFINSEEKSNELSVISNRLLEGSIYTTHNNDVATKSALVIMIHNGTI